ncbi:AAA family ATPase [Brucella sp. H1_1004]|uniref:AAA family ATPase n=1 Tax=Brucella sp. H1_1004 TaxID=3110109 RepID=UPI0039B64373
MAGTIEIQNLRNISKLRFDIPNRGVWLLTASNGGGKTSLLACLRRIGHGNAFPTHFPSSLKTERLDNHASGSVRYEINGSVVEYAYRGQRWTPRPRTNSHLFDQFGYDSVTYIGANADRITPRPEDFDPRHVRTVNKRIIDAANTIFETKKFSSLRTINLARGVGNDAFVLALATTPITYHSEKHFSLGELCVLKLLRLINAVNNNSMIIVDELEMALHPRAQVRLLNYLTTEAETKSLTVIFSTHSVTLLKSADRRRIIYLERQDDGEIRPIYGCFPTYAIGNIASDEETLPDLMLYVEDVFAREIVTAFFEKFANEKFADPTMRPTAKIVPVGGFQEVVAFMDRNKSVLPTHVKQKAILDQDVSTETLVGWRANENHSQLLKFNRQGADLQYLPFTPEVGLLEYITNNQNAFEQALRVRCADNQLRIAPLIAAYNPNLVGRPLRDSAKVAVEQLLQYVERQTQRSSDTVREQISGVFANSAWPQYRANFFALFGPMTA